jgi:hypothetical protein
VTGWLDPARRALDNAKVPVTFFFRDDDAGWSDGGLYRLLDLFEGERIPIDLAVIPTALGDGLAHCLAGRLRSSAGRLGLHQHGFSHANHERAGRKCEFGPSRGEADQVEDLWAGKWRLEAVMGPVFDPIFTPPWNRCTQATVDALASCGYRVLSRDIGASPLRLNDVAELPVCVDWCAWEKRGEDRAWIGRQIAEHMTKNRPVGIMLHHAAMSPVDYAAVANLLALLSGHGKARCVSMRTLAGIADVSPNAMTENR